MANPGVTAAIASLRQAGLLKSARRYTIASSAPIRRVISSVEV